MSSVAKSATAGSISAGACAFSVAKYAAAVPSTFFRPAGSLALSVSAENCWPTLATDAQNAASLADAPADEFGAGAGALLVLGAGALLELGGGFDDVPVGDEPDPPLLPQAATATTAAILTATTSTRTSVPPRPGTLATTTHNCGARFSAAVLVRGSARKRCGQADCGSSRYRRGVTLSRR
ncbi:MAG TPA: hypothetical protein VH395_04170, partial [Jatrophihabitantaceae bacterium]